MILVSCPGKPLSYTMKGTPRRGPIVKAFDSEIEALYAAVNESSQIDIQAPSPARDDEGWSVDDAVDFVRKAVFRVVKNSSSRTLGDTTDLFEAGCDR